jgi:sortase A
VIRTAVRTLGELLVTAGALLLLFAAWQLWWTDVEAGREQRAAVEALEETWRAERAAAPAAAPGPAPAVDGVDPAPAGEPPTLAPPAAGRPFALVRVPRFGSGYAVPAHEGVGLRAVLDRGVLGHYPGSAMPGEVGNFSLAGHRVTYGRPLNRIAELRAGDAVVVETAAAYYTYRVRESRVVRPGQVEVVAPVPGAPGAAPTERLLTLTACHPMYSARQRYIVHAELEGWQPVGEGEPAALQVAAG